MQELLKRIYDRTLNELSRLYKQLTYKDGMLAVTAVMIAAVCAMFIGVSDNGIFTVKVNNKFLGYINNKDTYKQAVEKIKADSNFDAEKYITAERTGEKPKNYLSEGQIEKYTRHEFGLKMPAYVIRANGIEAVRVSDAGEAQKVINGLVKLYHPKEGYQTFNVKSCTIKEKITVTKEMTDMKNILDVDDAIQKIADGRGIEKSYIVKQGDTLWDIALDNDMAVEDIQAQNPHMDINKIKPGQKIKLAVALPYINVEMKGNMIAREAIPFDSKSVTDKALKAGARKLRQKGANGIALVDKNITILNGDVTDESVISSRILAQARDEITIVGAKQTAGLLACTGFIRPSRGMLTSRFGRRWGRMHTGIDLASPTGTPIDAANSGKVEFTGWKRGYGLCIVIKHGKGLETLYGHASKLFVKPGQSISKGQKIAAVGSTGDATGPHVHFEVRKNGAPVNPFGYVK